MFGFSLAVGALDFIFYIHSLLMKFSPLNNNQEKKKLVILCNKYWTWSYVECKTPTKSFESLYKKLRFAVSGDFC